MKGFSVRFAFVFLLFIAVPPLEAQVDVDAYHTIPSVAGETWIVDASGPLPGVTAAVPSILVLSDGRIRLFFCSGPDGMKKIGRAHV